MDIYAALCKAFGSLNWWPGETRLEIIVGAILTQNTNWNNVEKAIDNLKERGLINFDKLYALGADELAHLIRPAGYYNQKARKLREMLKYLKQEYNGNLDELGEQSLDVIRSQLLKLWGIGPETADSILLYAFNMPIFVVDAYTFRVLSRHNFIPEDYTYDEIQEFFMDNLAPEVPLFNQFHALFVELGKRYCGKRKPLCDSCPIQFDLKAFS